MESDFQAPDSTEPFEPKAADLGGCGKPAVFGCLTVLVLLAVALGIFMFKVRGMLEWTLTKYEDAIVVNLSEEVSADDRQRLIAAFEAARTAIRENRIDPHAIQRLQRFMASPPDSRERIGLETVRELTEVLETIGKPAVGLPDQEFAPAPAESARRPGGLARPSHAAV